MNDDDFPKVNILSLEKTVMVFMVTQELSHDFRCGPNGAGIRPPIGLKKKKPDRISVPSKRSKGSQKFRTVLRLCKWH
jgi:hypothetical protein